VGKGWGERERLQTIGPSPRATRHPPTANVYRSPLKLMIGRGTSDARPCNLRSHRRTLVLSKLSAKRPPGSGKDASENNNSKQVFVGQPRNARSVRGGQRQSQTGKPKPYWVTGPLSPIRRCKPCGWGAVNAAPCTLMPLMALRIASRLTPRSRSWLANIATACLLPTEA